MTSGQTLYLVTFDLLVYFDFSSTKASRLFIKLHVVFTCGRSKINLESH
jgi:hypothetical protein